MWTRVASLSHSAPTVIARAATRAMRAGMTPCRQNAYDCAWFASSFDAVNPVRSQRLFSSTGRSGVNGPNTESFMTMTSAPGEGWLRWRRLRSTSVQAEKSLPGIAFHYSASHGPGKSGGMRRLSAQLHTTRIGKPSSRRRASVRRLYDHRKYRR